MNNIYDDHMPFGEVKCTKFNTIYCDIQFSIRLFLFFEIEANARFVHWSLWLCAFLTQCDRCVCMSYASALVTLWLVNSTSSHIPCTPARYACTHTDYIHEKKTTTRYTYYVFPHSLRLIIICFTRIFQIKYYVDRMNFTLLEFIGATLAAAQLFSYIFYLSQS